MALIRFAEGQQRSGSIGASVYSHNRFGAYIRARSVPVNPSTDRQVLVRGFVDNLQIAWNTVLTQAQRDDWNEYGANVNWQNALGETVHLTGPNHYVRTNTNVLLAGLTRIDDPPVIFDVAQSEQALAVVASEAAGTLSVAFDDTADWCSEDGAGQLVHMGIPVNPGKTFFKGPFRYADVLLGDSVAPLTSPQVIAAADVPWPFNEAQRIWVQTRILRADGRLSKFAQTNFLAVA